MNDEILASSAVLTHAKTSPSTAEKVVVLDVQRAAEAIIGRKQAREEKSLLPEIRASESIDHAVDDYVYSDCLFKTIDSDNDSGNYGLASERGYSYVERADNASDIPPIVRNAINTGQYARIVDASNSKQYNEAEMSMIRQARVANLQSESNRMRARYKRALCSAIEEVNSALTDVNASAVELEREVSGMQRVMRGLHPSAERVRLLELIGDE